MTAQPDRRGPSTFRSRLARVRRAMRSAQIESLLVCKLANARYLTGFTGSSALVLLSRSSAHLLTDGRYETQAHDEVRASGAPVEVIVYGSEGVGHWIRQLARDRSLEELHIEADAASWSLVLQLRRLVRGVKLRPVTGLIERARACKDREELLALERAAKATVEAYQDLLGWLRPGVSELEAVEFLRDSLVRRGAEGWAFDPIVAAGPRSAMPHARPTGEALRTGDVVVVDFGCRIDGYCSDMTRTVAIGNVAEDLVGVHKAVSRANRLARDVVAAGRRAGAVDAAARDYLASVGLADRFVHSTGHGLGLEIHEWPRIGKGSDDRIPLHCVVTVEPGVYLPGLGGVRIEDMVVAERSGNRLLTRASRELARI